jgi:hypothetical protein
MTDSHPGYEWPEGHGKPPKRVELDDKETIRSLEIPTCSKRTERLRNLLSKKPRKTK